MGAHLRTPLPIERPAAPRVYASDWKLYGRILLILNLQALEKHIGKICHSDEPEKKAEEAKLFLAKLKDSTFARPITSDL